MKNSLVDFKKTQKQVTVQLNNHQLPKGMSDSVSIMN